MNRVNTSLGGKRGLWMGYNARVKPPVPHPLPLHPSDTSKCISYLSSWMWRLIEQGEAAATGGCSCSIWLFAPSGYL